jgi:hypothetical protein
LGQYRQVLLNQLHPILKRCRFNQLVPEDTKFRIDQGEVNHCVLYFGRQNTQQAPDHVGLQPDA